MEANNESVKSKDSSSGKAWSNMALKAFWSNPNTKKNAETSSGLSCRNSGKTGREKSHGKIAKKKKKIKQNVEKFTVVQNQVSKSKAKMTGEVSMEQNEERTNVHPKYIKTPEFKSDAGSSMSSSIFQRDTDMEIDSTHHKKEGNSVSKAVNGSSNSFSEKLESSMFRMINERFYTSDSNSAIQMLKKDPSAFRLYHKGYQNQVNKWPIKPLQVITEYLNERNKDLVVADIGCGEGQLALSVHQRIVYSFDLESVNKHVTVCDAAKVHTKLDPNSVDVCVFCLSLMGSNLSEFIRSANKVLKVGGSLLIAEVSSRFEVVIRNKKRKKSKTVNDTKPFVEALVNFGYNLVSENHYGYFVFFEFCKSDQIKCLALAEISLKPCLYKKR